MYNIFLIEFTLYINYLPMNQPKVYVAAMNMRGIRADCSHIPNVIIINATSAQAKDNPNRLDYSPMTPIAGGYKGFWNFESYWQSGKVYEDIPRQKTLNYWQTLTAPKRRYPGSKGKRVLYAEWNGNQYNYVESRKQVYVPEYYALIKDKPSIAKYQQLLQQGTNIVVYDFDGPRNADGRPQCIEVSTAFYIEKINDTTHPFGHGYVVAGAVAGLAPVSYT